MARNTSSIVKQSRREGYALHPKAHKALVKRNTKPGQHGSNTFSRAGQGSQYNIQLREKQKVKRLYGLLEKQFRKTMDNANKLSGRSGENLLRLLETRLDNVIYRSGLAMSRPAARQLVSHGHFMLNDRRVDIPSIQVKIGDKIAIRAHSENTHYFKHLDEVSPVPSIIPEWLSVNRSKKAIEIKSFPLRDDAELDINEQLIVEYYSR